MRSQIITAKLKLLHTAEQANQFRELSLTYTNALNYVSKVAFNELKKSSNNMLASANISSPQTTTVSLSFQSFFQLGLSFSPADVFQIRR